MNKRSDLFDLINIMSKSEKRYFKVTAAQHTIKGKNKYVLLFDLINKQTEYDEKAIKAQIKDTMLKKNFAVEKNYLYNFLLKIITAFHSQKSLNAKASNSLYTIRLLTSKALYHQSNKLIEKTIKFAEQSENYMLLLELLKLKIEYLSAVVDNSQIKKTYERIFEIQKILDNVIQYRYLHDMMYDVLISIGKKSMEALIGDAKKILANDFLQSEDSGLCIEAKIRYHQTWALSYYLQKDYANAFKHSIRILELFEGFPLFQSENQNIYISALNNYIIFSVSLREFEKTKEKVALLKSLITQDATNRNNITIFSGTTLIETNYFITGTQFHKIYEVVEDYEKGFDLFGDKMWDSRKHGLFTNIAMLFFINEDYNLALKWINKIIHFEESPSTRPDMVAFAWLLNLIIHYELKNYDYLDYLMKSTSRYLTNKQLLAATGKAIIQFMKVQTKSADEEKKKAAPLVCLNTLNDKECKEEIADGKYLEIKLWVESKVGKISFANQLKQYYNAL